MKKIDSDMNFFYEKFDFVSLLGFKERDNNIKKNMRFVPVLFLFVGQALAFLPLISSRVRSSSLSPSMAFDQVPQFLESPNALSNEIAQALGLQEQKVNRGLLFDLKETLDNYEIAIDVPGVKKEDITLDVKERMLRISMEKKGMTKEETDTFRRIERFHGHMSRILSLPDNVDAESIDASVIDGVLHVKIPKKEGEKEKKIEIK